MQSGLLNYGPIAAPFVTLPYVATTVLPAFQANNFEMVLTGNLSLSNPLGPVQDGQSLLLRFIQDATGSRTLTLAGSQFRLGTTLTGVTLTTTANLTDYIALLWNARATKWDVVGFMQGY